MDFKELSKERLTATAESAIAMARNFYLFTPGDWSLCLAMNVIRLKKGTASIMMPESPIVIRISGEAKRC